MGRLGNPLFGKGKKHPQQQPPPTKPPKVVDETATVVTTSSASSSERRPRKKSSSSKSSVSSRRASTTSPQPTTDSINNNNNNEKDFEAFLRTVFDGNPSSTTSSSSSPAATAHSIVPSHHAANESESTLMDEPWLTSFLNLGYDGHQRPKTSVEQQKQIRPEDLDFSCLEQYRYKSSSSSDSNTGGGEDENEDHDCAESVENDDDDDSTLAQIQEWMRNADRHLLDDTTQEEDTTKITATTTTENEDDCANESEIARRTTADHTYHRSKDVVGKTGDHRGLPSRSKPMNMVQVVPLLLLALMGNAQGWRTTTHKIYHSNCPRLSSTSSDWQQQCRHPTNPLLTQRKMTENEPETSALDEFQSTGNSNSNPQPSSSLQETGPAPTTESITTISDAEALIACRNYLQKRKRWGRWTKAESRKEKRKRFQGDLQAGSDRSGGLGFFWEDPSALKYLHKPSVSLNSSTSTGSRNSKKIPWDGLGDIYSSGDTSSVVDHIDPVDLLDDEEDEEGGVEDEIWESVKLQGSMERRDILPLFENDKLLGDAAEEFSSFFDGPSEEHLKRSDAAKRTWSDPEWRKMWYKKRWGNKERMNAAFKRQRNAENRLQQMDSDTLLENEALATMTEDEIAEAIDEHVRLSRKQKNSSQLEKPKQPKEEPSLLDLYVSGNDDVLKQKQRDRSQRARQAYKSRIVQKKQPAGTSIKEQKEELLSDFTKARRFDMDDQSPQAALLRIEACLEQKIMPSQEDIKLVLQPTRLSGRKPVLLRILSECFGLRGKCIPTGRDAEEDTLEFATKASISNLGNFILQKVMLEQEKSSLDS